MDQDSWRKIEEIYHLAAEIEGAAERIRFLDESCGSDTALRREVESLLAERTAGDDFLSHPQLSLGLSVLASEQGKTLVGEIVGHYRIVEQLGRGGMGVVYLAKDLRLARDVALKVLSPHIGSEKFVERFKMEARAASAISHPNVAHIYEIAEHEERLFIAMEFVEGRTLREFARGGSFDLIQAVDIAVQTASGLAAAHSKGIVHRDIKPENIIIRPDGLVKVVDFGLAKSTAIGASPFDESSEDQPADRRFEPNLDLSEPGVLMGTAKYMSPEQARGYDTDARTDVWSLGIVLYELVAGYRPFEGETASEVITSILKGEPRPLPPDTPDELSALIGRALQKNPDQRYASANELLLDLKNLGHRMPANRSTLGGSADQTTNENQFAHSTAGERRENYFSANESHISTIVDEARETPPPKFPPKSVTVGLVTAALAAVMLNFSLPRLNEWYAGPAAFQKMNPRKLTTAGTLADEIAAVSPDGRYVAYVAQQGSLRSLWLKQTSDSTARQLVPPAEVTYFSLSFTRDGTQLYYTVMAGNSPPALLQIPSAGGTPMKLSDDVGDGRVTFSPGGDRYAFIRAARTLMIADLAGGEPRTVAEALADGVWHFPAWSPDGKTIMLGADTPDSALDRLIEIAVHDGTASGPVGPPWYRISGVAWLSDKSGVLVAGRDPETKLSQIWRIDYPAGTARKITNDLSSYKAVGVAADGRSLVTVQHERVSNIYVVPEGDTASARKITLERGTDDGMSGIAVTSDNRIIYTSQQDGTRDLWIVNRDGSGNRRLTSGLKYSVFPVVSPDDRFVAFVADISGSPNIWRLDMADGSLKQLTLGPGISAYPSFSPDGNWIYYQHTENHASTIWKIGRDGEGPVQVTTQGDASRPTVSPDGNFIACIYEEAPDSPARVAVFPASGGSDPIKVIDSGGMVNSYNLNWSTDGKALIYIDGRNGSYNLWSQAISGGKPEQLTNLTSGQIYRFARSRDGKDLILSLSHESSDIILISNFD